MNPLRPALALVGAALTVTPALAAEDVPLPCRPTIACTAEIVAPGRAEVELGYAARRIGTDFQHTTPVLLKLTVTERLQLQVGTNGWTFQPGTSRYLDDTVFLAKVALVKQSEAVPAISASLAMATPTSVGTLGYRPGVDAQGIVYASKDVGPIHGDLNVGLNVLELDRTPRHQPFAAFSASSDVGHGLTPMAEVYGFAGAGRAAPRDVGFLAALGVAVGSWCVLDVGGDVGLGAQDRSFTLFVGFTALSPRAWRT
ncbi:MAG TPA: hypothetical protein VFP50_04705 [Anaeromyxobacteraceae bacterium]|nr:hypothetical protein [Anaeromyxobacteraceae bacterium]